MEEAVLFPVDGFMYFYNSCLFVDGKDTKRILVYTHTTYTEIVMIVDLFIIEKLVMKRYDNRSYHRTIQHTRALFNMLNSLHNMG